MNDQNKLTWERFIQALTDPDQAFSFPIKYPAIELDKQTRETFYTSAAILGGSIIIAALIYANKK